MNKPVIARMIAEHAEAIKRNEYPISHGTICDVLAELAADAITESQALSILKHNAEQMRSAPERAAIYQQAIDALQALQAAEQ